MNQREIKGLGSPSSGSSAVNKKYLEDNTLTLNGVNVMKGNLKMGQNNIIGLADPTGGQAGGQAVY